MVNAIGRRVHANVIQDGLRVMEVVNMEQRVIVGH
jgi:hypothetical protein